MKVVATVPQIASLFGAPPKPMIEACCGLLQRSGVVAAPTPAPTAPPTRAPGRMPTPVTAPMAAPEPAPMAPPVTARWPHVSPHAVAQNRIAIVTANLLTDMIASQETVR
jgi:hypothetical protein